HSAPTAAYDAQAHPPCHPGTPALRTVSEWMFSTRSSRNPVLWLHGPSQALNSSIAKHVADKCAQRGELAGSFFFSSEPTRPKQNSITHLVPTLALQLAFSPLRGFRPALLKALDEDPSLIHQSIPTQVERLILEPLQGLTSPGPFLVIIDALDQCKDEENQREVLAQLARIMQEPHNPLRFIITSTNAPHLRRAFDAPDLNAVSASSSILPTQMREGEPLQMWQAAAQAVALSCQVVEGFASAIIVVFSSTRAQDEMGRRSVGLLRIAIGTAFPVNVIFFLIQTTFGCARSRVFQSSGDGNLIPSFWVTAENIPPV
ncbi:hypothetical protein DXG01_003651, partial [Tephrocybe rancida]